MRNTLLILGGALCALALLFAISLGRDQGKRDRAREVVDRSAAEPAHAPRREPVNDAEEVAYQHQPPSEPPDPNETPEQRKVREIEALVRAGQVGHARALTDEFYRAYPRSPERQKLERLTGYHPRPYGP